MKSLVCALGIAALVGGAASTVAAQGRGPEHAPIQIPDSSVEQPGERGVAAHTNHLIRIGPEAVGAVPRGETPSSIASIYGLTNLAITGAGLIVIVDAFHYPTALNDFNVFAMQFGLPQELSTNPLDPNNQVFQVVYAGGGKPRTNCGGLRRRRSTSSGRTRWRQTPRLCSWRRTAAASRICSKRSTWRARSPTRTKCQ